MTEPATTPVAPLGLFARAVGILFSPKATYQNVVAAPRPFGILFISALLIGIGATIPQLTEQARVATLQAQVQGMERFGVTVTPEIQQRMEERSRNTGLKLLGILFPLIIFPLLALLLTALLWAFFNVLLGGTATFKQVLAVNAHSYVITAVGALVSAPILFYKFQMTMGGPFNFGALVPLLERESALAQFLTGVNLFSLWAWFVLAIGLGVLYRRKTFNIAISLFVLYLLFTYGLTRAFGSFFGR
jgi:hypothetical protein